MLPIHYLTKAQLSAFFQSRAGENRLAEHCHLPDPALDLYTNLARHAAAGGQFVLLGIPEDIGPRANCGLPGATLGWQAFLTKFLNLQANTLLNTQQLLVLGEVSCADLQQQSSNLNAADNAELAQLRQLCAELDERVYAAIAPIFAVGLTPIIIGGGHNNALPLLQALHDHTGQAANCINIDPHADFRALEGRHSGNGFSYAMEQRLLQHYLVLGLHQQKNNAASLAALTAAGADFISYQQIFVSRQLSWQQAIDQACDKVLSAHTPLALELDTDAITAMPASALNYSGISVAEAEQAVYQLARFPATAYLHLAEAAPAQHPSGVSAGLNHCGQVLSQLVQAFILGKQRQAAVVE
jgi:formiminoglutamase